MNIAIMYIYWPSGNAESPYEILVEVKCTLVLACFIYIMMSVEC